MVNQPGKRFGLAQLGYIVNAQGFTVSVTMPSYVWFNKLNAALSASFGRKPAFITFGGEKFKKLGAAYKQIAEKLNTGIQPAYIYKKVE